MNDLTHERSLFALAPLAPVLLGLGLGLGPGCLGDFERPEPEPAHQHHDWDGDGYCEAEPCPGGVGAGDCDDENADVYPGAPQVCDEAEDNDCDGEPDFEEADNDLDGFSLCDGDCDDTDAFLDLDDADGDGDSTCTGDCDDGDAALNTVDADGDGYVTCDDGVSEVDCDDSDGAVYPGAPDLCDDVEDNDCDGAPDAQEVDDDGDGYTECEGDCDDGDASIEPGAVEICDGLDNDCNGTVDDALDQDTDGDGYSPCDGDCDDTDPMLGPAAAELCDGEDNDCDGVTDDGCIECDTEVPSLYLDIQSALDAGTPEQDLVVCVGPGTYYENLDFGGNTIRLVGTAGAAQTVVDGGGSGTVLRIASGEPGARVEGLTLTNGAAQRGGGVFIDFGAQVEMIGVHITGNTAELQGGGIDLRDGAPSSLYLADSVISENVVTSAVGTAGGGMRIEESSTAELVNVVIRDNEVDHNGGGVWTAAGFSAVGLVLSGNTAGDMGGGVYATGGTIYIVDLELSGNESSNSGGGMVLNNSADVTFEQASVVDNHAGGSGGAVYAVNWSQLYALNTTFAGNSADSSGGAIHMTGSSDAMLDTVIFAGNSSGADGGAVYAGGSSSPSLSHVTLVGNHAGVNGGGIATGDINSQPALNSVILAGNDADNAGGGLSAEGADMWLLYCSLWNNLPDDYTGMSDPMGQTGNVYDDPLFLDQSNADPSLWDLHLGDTSALIDAGNPTLFDPDGGVTDMGAYSGPRAGLWDRDDDGFFEWWQPGEYDPSVYPGVGWDCDDRDALITPDNGCS